MNTLLCYIFDIYGRLFSKKIFYKLNRLMHLLSLRGIGISNYKNEHVSGENNFINSLKYRYKNNIITIFDVGANKGKYSSKIKEVFPDANVFAFEPHPKTFAILEECARTNNFSAYNCGVGNLNTKLALYDYAENELDGSEHASLYKDVIEVIHNGNVHSIDVDIITLDDFVGKHGINAINLLKIDTEGNELNVLKGAAVCLKMNIIEMIHFEFNGMNVISRTYMKDFFELLHNFKLYRMLSDGLVPLTYDPLICEIFAFQNIVAVKNR